MSTEFNIWLSSLGVVASGIWWFFKFPLVCFCWAWWGILVNSCEHDERTMGILTILFICLTVVACNT